MARVGDLAKMAFDSAYLLNNRTPRFVSCDYIHNKGIRVRMALFTDVPATALGNAWSDEPQRDGSTLPGCRGPVASRCTFTHPALMRGWLGAGNASQAG
ncbi:hypothetical protein GCM10011289_09480 [Paludibacterium paludis]|uniref:Uncharacterized protein n=2 Tax=Paludibacterium paludis TaxID=1225769 RepID=A0A918NZE0_9NEIS|nr:hypothetical protein GCM10011289_09480 [Paludibacterium paludis]